MIMKLLNAGHNRRVQHTATVYFIKFNRNGIHELSLKLMACKL